MVTNCPNCGRECKDERGLQIHINKCGQIKIFKCEHCEVEFKSKKNLQVHYSSCKIYKGKQELEKYNNTVCEKNNEIKQIKLYYNMLLQTELRNYEDKLSKLTLEYDRKIDTLKNEMKLDKNIFECKYTDAINKIDLFKTQVESLQKENKSLSSKNSYIQQKLLSQKEEHNKTIIHNHNHTINNTFNLQHFDPSILLGKITPPDRMLWNIDMLFNYFKQNGLCNFYKVMDRSRKSLLWYDKDGKEIRDSNGSHIATSILQVIEPDIRDQIRHLQSSLEKLLKKPVEYDTSENIIRYKEAIDFCNSLLAPIDPKIMSKITKGISNMAKDSDDNTADSPKIIPGFTIIKNVLKTALFPHVDEWLNLSLFEFGQYLGEKVHKYFMIEPVSMTIKQIYVKNDNNETIIVKPLQLSDFISNAVNTALDNTCKEIVYYLNTKTLEYNNDNSTSLIEWLTHSPVDDEHTEKVFMGLCQYTKRNKKQSKSSS